MFRSTLVWALVALNMLLAAALVGRWMKPSTAMAQAANRPGDYIIVPAEVVGGNGAIVYIIDTTRGQLSAMAMDQNRLTAMAPVDLNRVYEARAAGARGARD
jgi:hypothetical protein